MFYLRGLLEEDSLEKRPRPKEEILQEVENDLQGPVFLPLISALKMLKILPTPKGFYEDEQDTESRAQEIAKLVMKKIRSW